VSYAPDASLRTSLESWVVRGNRQLRARRTNAACASKIDLGAAAKQFRVKRFSVWDGRWPRFTLRAARSGHLAAGAIALLGSQRSHARCCPDAAYSRVNTQKGLLGSASMSVHEAAPGAGTRAAPKLSGEAPWSGLPAVICVEEGPGSHFLRLFKLLGFKSSDGSRFEPLHRYWCYRFNGQNTDIKTANR